MKELILTSIPKEDLETLIIGCVNACLKHYEPATVKQAANDPEQLLTKKEAAKLLSCATSSIDNYRRNGRIKRYYVGSSVRFKRGELLAAVDQMSTNKKSR